MGQKKMRGNLTFNQLKEFVRDGEIDTVICALPDMQGRLMGKRFEANFFVEHAWEETHCCNYLIATDLEMNTVDGYASTGWSQGYGDYVMKPDIETLRIIPWLENTALVLCDLHDQITDKPIVHSPRAILRHQISRLESLGYRSMMATELEFFIFNQSYEEMRESHFRAMTPISAYNEDYHIFQTTKEESLMRRIRNGLYQAGVKVENTKGEAEAGQAEINIHYADPLAMADTHVLVKNAVKEIAWQQGRSITFMAKWHHDRAGSSSHIHQSLQTMDGRSAFYDSGAEHGMSEVMRSYLAGLLAYTDEATYFLAPYINSYKRFSKGMFAPTKAIWSIDNRTAGYRVAAPQTPGVRVECRVGGADLNPYLALASQIALGIAGIEQKLELEAAYQGDAYRANEAREIPPTLREATETLRGSQLLRNAMGEGVIDHYVRAAEWEQEDFDQKVTDYEISRCFERV